MLNRMFHYHTFRDKVLQYSHTLTVNYITQLAPITDTLPYAL